MLMLVAAWIGPRRVSAADPEVTVGAAGAKVHIVSSSLAEAINALARAAGFEVKYDGAQPSAMLFNLDIEAASVPQALLRLLEGQGLNYGLALDATGTRVTSLLITAPAPRLGAAGTPAPAPPSATAPRTLPFGAPRSPRGVPIIEDTQPDDESTPEEAATPTPTPTPSPAPAPTPGFRPGSSFPPVARPPFGQPFGPRPTPAVSPLP